MIKEAYVSFETAKLLKEKGFNTHLITFYLADKEKNEGVFQTMAFSDDVVDNSSEIYCLAPTQQMAMCWLREIHGLFISINLDDLDWSFQVLDIKNRDENLDPTCLSDSYACHECYEDAVEAGIKYCLKNLI